MTVAMFVFRPSLKGCVKLAIQFTAEIVKTESNSLMNYQDSSQLAEVEKVLCPERRRL